MPGLERSGPLRRRKGLTSTKGFGGRSKRLKARSDKTADRDARYSEVRLEFLDRNPRCKIRWEGCSTWASDVHHMAGRSPSVFWDQSLWMPACRPCHRLVTDNPQRAYDAGMSVRRNEQASGD